MSASSTRTQTWIPSGTVRHLNFAEVRTLRRCIPAVCLAVSIGVGSVHEASAVVYYAKDEAFELAFGAGAAIEPRPLFLTEEQVAAIEAKAKVKFDSQLFTFYEGRQASKLLGYAALESHNVRTQAETLMLVLSPRGELTKAVMLAFHEPPEYKPPDRWYDGLVGKPAAELVLNHGVDGVSGATLSVRAALESVRKVLTLYEMSPPGGQE